MGRLKTETWERMLEQMEQEGVGFYLNGKKTAPREIIRTCCMREKAVYCRILSWMRKENSAKSGTMK